MKKMRLVAPVLGAALLLGVGVAPVAAATSVSVAGCALSYEGERHITPDFVYLTSGWGATTKGQLLSGAKALTWNVTVDGTPINVTPFITDPYQDPDTGTWWVTFVLPVGYLAYGESMTASVEYVLSRPVFDGVDHFPAGSLGPFSCTISADS